MLSEMLSCWLWGDLGDQYIWTYLYLDRASWSEADGVAFKRTLPLPAHGTIMFAYVHIPTACNENNVISA